MQKAARVIGGGKPGVMARPAKWAFGNTSPAGALARAEGGRVAIFG